MRSFVTAMLLKRVAPHLAPHLAALLPKIEAAGFQTTDALILARAGQVSALTSLPAYQVDALILACIDLTAPPAVRGDKAVEPAGAWHGFGPDGLDDLFGAWNGVGIVEVCGPKRAGKSLLALHATLRCLRSNKDVRARWVDTEGAFNAARAQAVLEKEGAEDIESVLRRLEITNCFKLEPDLFDVLGELRAEEDEGTRVLVIDNVNTLFRDGLMGSTSQGRAAMVTLMEEVAELTHARGMLSIVTNMPVSSVPTNPLSVFSATTTKAGLGTAFTYAVDVSLFLQPTSHVFELVDADERERAKRPGVRCVAEVLKSRVSLTDQDGINLLDVRPASVDDEHTARMSRGVDTGRPDHGPLSTTVVP